MAVRDQIPMVQSNLTQMDQNIALLKSELSTKETQHQLEMQGMRTHISQLEQQRSLMQQELNTLNTLSKQEGHPPPGPLGF